MTSNGMLLFGILPLRVYRCERYFNIFIILVSRDSSPCQILYHCIAYKLSMLTYF